MKVASTQQGNVTVLEVAGEFTWDFAGRFNDAVDVAFAAGRRDFIVDLEQVEVLDSAGLEALTALQRRCDEHLGMLRCCGLRPDLRKILELTRLDHTFAVDEEQATALANMV